jgi:predicted transcriptional regulator
MVLSNADQTMNLHEERINRLEATEVFRCKARTKLLQILAEVGELNISELCRRAHINHYTGRKHLNFLAHAGILQEKRFGRVRIFRLRVEVLKVRAIQTFFELWADAPHLRGDPMARERQLHQLEPTRAEG